MKRRGMRGIPRIIQGISFGSVDDGFRAPLHRKLGIETYVHRQAILFDPHGQVRGRNWEGTDQHWYRYPVTLAKVFA